MKKLLSILGSVMIVGSSAVSVVSCANPATPDNKPIDIKGMTLEGANADRTQFSESAMEKSIGNQLISDFIENNSNAFDGKVSVTDFSAVLSKTAGGPEMSNQDFIDIQDGASFFTVIKAKLGSTRVTGDSSSFSVKISDTKEGIDITDATSWSDKQYQITKEEQESGNELWHKDLIAEFYASNKEFFDQISLKDTTSFVNVSVQNASHQEVNSADVQENTVYNISFSINPNSTDPLIKSGKLIGTSDGTVKFLKSDTSIQDLSKLDDWKPTFPIMIDVGSERNDENYIENILSAKANKAGLDYYRDVLGQISKTTHSDQLASPVDFTYNDGTKDVPLTDDYLKSLHVTDHFTAKFNMKAKSDSPYLSNEKDGITFTIRICANKIFDLGIYDSTFAKKFIAQTESDSQEHFTISKSHFAGDATKLQDETLAYCFDIAKKLGYDIPVFDHDRFSSLLDVKYYQDRTWMIDPSYGDGTPLLQVSSGKTMQLYLNLTPKTTGAAFYGYVGDNVLEFYADIVD